ncbi:(2Fe-2S)-binding protein [candidate division CSSED10-310 bacterium]|uniref:(2Fe-2S)-binding protein n=1 Tax=candidate division CSSED10-310 bacterium TaxID=2855610 RepID=A0ABV6Z570_UNCC1
MNITVTINGKTKEYQTSSAELLVDFLRRHGLHGVKKGCGEGNCGSCMVLLNGKAVNSCLILAPRVHDKKITTIEGLGSTNNMHPLQESYIEHAAVQCGFCTPGSIISAVGLINENPSPEENDIKQALDGNLCRCTGFKKKIEAVQAAARKMKK